MCNAIAAREIARGRHCISLASGSGRGCGAPGRRSRRSCLGAARRVAKDRGGPWRRGMPWRATVPAELCLGRPSPHTTACTHTRTSSNVGTGRVPHPSAGSGSRDSRIAVEVPACNLVGSGPADWCELIAGAPSSPELLGRGAFGRRDARGRCLVQRSG